jgi:hypothetical protein
MVRALVVVVLVACSEKGVSLERGDALLDASVLEHDASVLDVGLAPDTGSIRFAGSEVSWLVRSTSIDPVPANLSETQIELLATDDLDVMRPVSTVTISKGNGTFSITPVPTGPRYLVLKSNDVSTVGIETTFVPLDFGETLYGRGDAVYGGVFLDLALTNLFPLEDRYPLGPIGTQLYVLFGQAFAIDPSPSLGATSVAGTANLSILLTDTSRGDLFQLGQWVTERTADSECRTLDRHYDPGSVAMNEGDRVNLRGAMVQLPRNEIITVDWDREAFAALSLSAGTAIQLDVYGSVVSGGHIGLDQSIHHCTAPLIALAPSTILRFSNPYPSGWVKYFRYAAAIDESRFVEGFQVVDGSTVHAAPTIGPVLAVEVNGRPAAAINEIREGVVDIRWRPPSMGRPTLYRVKIGSSPEYSFPGDVDVYTVHTQIALPVDLVRRRLRSLRSQLTITAFAGQTGALSTSPVAGGAAHHRVGELVFLRE